MPPRDGRYPGEPGWRLAIPVPPVPGEQRRQQHRIVGDDDAGGEPAALVRDRDVEIGATGELLRTPGPGDRRAQLMIGLDPVLRSVDIRLQLMIADVVDRVDGVRLNKRHKSPIGLPVTHYLTRAFASFRSPDFGPLRRPDFWMWPTQIESIRLPICPN
jgi:hypothetical protein